MQLTTQSNLPSLRMLILIDVVLCAIFAMLLLATAPWLADEMQLPTVLLRGAGLFLIPWTAYLVYTWIQPRIVIDAARAIVTVNIAWVLGSLAIIATDAAEPNRLGVAFVSFQAAGVFLLATGQYLRARTLS